MCPQHHAAPPPVRPQCDPNATPMRPQCGPSPISSTHLSMHQSATSAAVYATSCANSGVPCATQQQQQQQRQHKSLSAHRDARPPDLLHTILPVHLISPPPSCFFHAPAYHSQLQALPHTPDPLASPSCISSPNTLAPPPCGHTCKPFSTATTLTATTLSDTIPQDPSAPCLERPNPLLCSKCSFQCASQRGPLTPASPSPLTPLTAQQQTRPLHHLTTPLTHISP
jgi:hypothetical protein